jgi:tetratricopeptide (TPR) repeat protein
VSERNSRGAGVASLQAIGELIDLGDIDRAVVLLDKVPRHGPFRDQWLVLKSLVLQHTDGIQSAVKFLERNLRQSRELINARAHLANLLFADGDHRRAAFHLEGLLEVVLNDSQRDGVLYNLGRCYESAQLERLAIKRYQKVSVGSAQFFDATQSAATLLVKEGSGDLALRFFLDRLCSLEESTRSDSWWRLLQNLVLQVNQPKLVREEFALRSAHLGVPNAVGRHIDGLLYEQVDQFAPAIECYEQAIRLDPSLHVSRYNLGLVQLRLGQFTEGFKNYWHRRFVEEFSLNCLSSAVRMRLDLSPPPQPQAASQWFAWYEQGLGETLLFLRAARERICVGQVTCVLQDRLYSALRTYEDETGIRCLAGVISESEAISAGSPVHTLLGDLAGCGFNGRNVGPASPAPQSLSTHLRCRGTASVEVALRPDTVRVGLCGNSYNPELGVAKSVSLGKLVAYAHEAFPDLTVRFVNLDHRLGDAQFDSQVMSLPGDEKVYSGDSKRLVAGHGAGPSLEEICRRLAGVDVVLASSCTVVHLAGFLGVPTKLFLTDVSRRRFWYWGRMDAENPQSFWYESVSLA